MFYQGKIYSLIALIKHFSPFIAQRMASMLPSCFVLVLIFSIVIPELTQALSVTVSCPSSTGATSGIINPGSTATLAALVTPTSAISNAIVSFEIYNSTGQKVDQTYKSSLSLQANVGNVVKAFWALPMDQDAGDYTVKVLVYTSGWATLLVVKSSCSAFTVVIPSPKFTISCPATVPTSVYQGATVAFSTNIAATWPVNGAIVSFEIYNSAGVKVANRPPLI